MFSLHLTWYVPLLVLTIGIVIMLFILLRNLKSVMHAVNEQPVTTPVLIEQVKDIGAEQARVAEELLKQQVIIKKELTAQQELIRKELEHLNPGDALKENQEIIIEEQHRVAEEKREDDAHNTD